MHRRVARVQMESEEASLIFLQVCFRNVILSGRQGWKVLKFIY